MPVGPESMTIFPPSRSLRLPGGLGLLCTIRAAVRTHKQVVMILCAQGSNNFCCLQAHPLLCLTHWQAYGQQLLLFQNSNYLIMPHCMPLEYVVRFSTLAVYFFSENECKKYTLHFHGNPVSWRAQNAHFLRSARNPDLNTHTHAHKAKSPFTSASWQATAR